MKSIQVLAAIIYLSFCHISQAQILEDANYAFAESASSQKPVLLVFSGSDWCAPCIRFHKNVLSDENFIVYAEDHFIILKADFPQRKKLNQDQVQQNEKLADQYNPKGQFPHIVLLAPDRTLLKTLYFKNQTAQQFIAELSHQFAE